MEKKEQNTYFSNIVKVASKLFTSALDKDDTLSLYRCRKLVKASPFIHNALTSVFTEANASYAIYISVNLATVVYQNLYASWFLYFVTSIGAMKKILYFIFENQTLGVFFFVSFYFRMLASPDIERFDNIAKFLNLPQHADLGQDKFIADLVKTLPDKLAVSNSNLKNITTAILIKVASITTATGIASLPVLLETLITSEEIEVIPKPAVYITPKDVLTETDMKEMHDKIIELRKTELKKLKKKIPGKKKKKLKLKLQQIIEKKTDTGEIICLDECKEKMQTRLGCYCESDCGKTFKIGGKSWCYVNADKCKRGKYLPRYMGYAYDYCDKNNVTTKKCYSGTRYIDCDIK